MKKIKNAATNDGSKASTSGANSNEENDEEEDNPVEIGRKGSGIYVKESKLKIARQRGTFKAMGNSLVDILFNLNVLLVSNLRGGKRKVQARDGANPESFQALDKKIIQAIYSEYCFNRIFYQYSFYERNE